MYIMDIGVSDYSSICMCQLLDLELIKFKRDSTSWDL